MPDLNDYAVFARVVAHGGFAAAGRALGQPKSTLSRRVAALEERLGVRLIERSSRGFQVTEVGRAFYERCRAILIDVEQAESIVAEALGEPQGRIRFSCPTGLVEVVAPSLPAFLERYPKVRLQVLAVDRAVDLIEERIDVALRVRTTLDTDAALTMRSLGHSSRILVAAPSFAARCSSADVSELDRLPTLSSSDEAGEVAWRLFNAAGEARTIRHEPRMTCADFSALRTAATAGVGVALLPDHVCRRDLESGRLVRVYPDWETEIGVVHIVFTTRRGLPPAVRALIDHLAAVFRLDG